jgi:hypothetical protein
MSFFRRIELSRNLELLLKKSIQVQQRKKNGALIKFVFRHRKIVFLGEEVYSSSRRKGKKMNQTEQIWYCELSVAA